MSQGEKGTPEREQSACQKSATSEERSRKEAGIAGAQQRDGDMGSDVLGGSESDGVPTRESAGMCRASDTPRQI